MTPEDPADARRPDDHWPNGDQPDDPWRDDFRLSEFRPDDFRSEQNSPQLQSEVPVDATDPSLPANSAPQRPAQVSKVASNPVAPPRVSPNSLQPPASLEIHRIDNSRSTEVTLAGSRKTSPTGQKSDAKTAAPKSPPTNQRSTQTLRRPDPILQSLMLLVTMACMLAAARYAVPSIVEEIRFAWHRGELRAEYETGTDGLKNVSLDTLSQAYQMVTSVVGPSVVHIEVERRSPANQSQVNRLLSTQMMPAADQGSGVIVDKAGYIVTNRHVIADGEDITVTLSDGREVGASIVGTDALTDLAVLKIDGTGLIPIQWGDSDRSRVGSPVWAVGSPFGFDRSVTFGILSGKHRMVRASTRYQDFMQSDVAVNPGNSGGPLVDAKGQLIGINTAIVGDTYQGVSFSIPSNVVNEVYEQLIRSGRVDRGWLGVSLAEVPDDQFVGENHRMRGALVGGLADRRSPAAIAGVLPGDIITAVDGVEIRDMGHLMRIIGNAIAGSEVELSVRRKESANTITVKKLRVRLNARPTELTP
ncbi:S1C family serine protease [Planctomycetes bacterium K23_9]|uniref:Serine protease HtrA n=1 Tax=Stieleria marina TaxID=1930275 RepID=A0A517NP55_9BACT|nr:Putative serine protease HtrA [Planctomycetes bacterium K23_9]